MRMLSFAVLLSTVGAWVPASAGDAQPFAPGVISTAYNETSATFSPDGREMYFMRGDLVSSRNAILSARRKDDGSYGDVRLAPFSGTWNDSEPHVSPDGRRLYFVSNRPVHPGGESLVAKRGRMAFPGANLWYVERKGDGWGEPVHIGGEIARVPMVYNPSVAANGNLYFSAHREDAGAGFQVYKVTPEGEGWSAPVQVALGKGVQANHMDPAIDPRERFMLFAGDEGDSAGAADIYIVFRSAAGGWDVPIRLPGEVNSRFLENAPSLGRAFGEIYVTSMRPAPSHFPREDNDLAALNRHLDAALNGSRNLWRFDISALLREHGIHD
ncbi:PD40 domain-containing protein [Pseudoxanthomonas sp. PXM01]|uniref:TolB family protein n=1 Tax=Pseudoxanthomonas sp. PXM01 TaxID=2769295 RepID=UPI00177CD5AC|nr:PD40 domain-containing protein [Pseudoxanthomonas sp. PXM01]MBD9468058.1 PD40 domain-containing protein [Pseudoxanthomonas sp. PXM01]